MAAARQFPRSYQESRSDFLEDLKRVQTRWPSARLESRSVSAEEDLAIEWIAADPIGSPEKALILTCGLHGVEGYLGSRMRGLLVDEFLDQIDPGTTTLYLFHAINPWGMKQIRRVTRNNVDLNRNFANEEGEFQEDINLAYRQYDSILNPDRPLLPLWIEIPGMIAKIVVELQKSGIKVLRNAVLQGQRSNLRGIFGTGREYEPETLVMMDFIQEIFSNYQDIVVLDMHTGYGPKYQMSIINSPQESRTTKQMEVDFHYPLVLKADPEDFYTMQGDMVNWLYDYQESTGWEGKLYAAAFEFGTIGDTKPGEFISLWNMIFENQLHWKGARFGITKNRVKKIFLEMFYPSELKWRGKALEDCKQALSGVLNSEGYI